MGVHRGEEQRTKVHVLAGAFGANAECRVDGEGRRDEDQAHREMCAFKKSRWANPTKLARAAGVMISVCACPDHRAGIKRQRKQT